MLYFRMLTFVQKRHTYSLLYLTVSNIFTLKLWGMFLPWLIHWTKWIRLISPALPLMEYHLLFLNTGKHNMLDIQPWCIIILWQGQRQHLYNSKMGFLELSCYYNQQVPTGCANSLGVTTISHIPTIQNLF